MSLKGALDASKTVSLFRFWQNLYSKSRTHRLMKQFREKTKICFRYSFFSKVSGIEKSSPQILSDSCFAQYLINFIKKGKSKLSSYLRASSAAAIAKDTGDQAHFSPWTIINISLIVTVGINTFLALMLEKQISSLGWIFRALLLLIGIGGLFSKATWPIIKADSFFLKRRQE